MFANRRMTGIRIRIILVSSSQYKKKQLPVKPKIIIFAKNKRSYESVIITLVSTGFSSDNPLSGGA
jgi:hypothetical protein